jgi:CheY-like chemotaxis protein
MDVQMPVMDGFAATEAIRHELHLELPVIAMSAGVTLDERAECEAAGMNGFVAKPIDGDDLITTILHFVHARAGN